MNTIYLSDVDGEMCVCYKDTKYGEPKYTLSHFPTGIKTRDFEANYYPLSECDLMHRGGAYGVLKKGGYYTNTLTLHLVNGGKTIVKKYEEVDIPCPKVRAGIKTRWNDFKGCWEKELKSGWCTA